MPYRTLQEAALRPLPPESKLRTIPRAALVLTLAAQVVVWVSLVVSSWTVLIYLQTAAEHFDLQLAWGPESILRVGKFVRDLSLLLFFVITGVLLGEIWFFVRRRPFIVSRFKWSLWLLFSLILPFGVLLVGGLMWLQIWLRLLSSIGRM